MAKPPLGSGERFAALEEKLSNQPGITDPGALAASIGRKKYGPVKFSGLAAKGKSTKTKKHLQAEALEKKGHASGGGY